MNISEVSRTQSNRLRSISLDNGSLSEVLDRLDRDAQEAQHADKREFDRYEYRIKGLIIDLIQPGGKVSPWLVPTRNISRRGFSFLHGGFVHANTPVRAMLVTTQNTWRTVYGKVNWCKYVEGRIYEVGIELNDQIDVGLFSAEAVHHRVLIADDDQSTCRLLSFHLNQLKSEVGEAHDGREAMEKALSHDYDCILLDVDIAVINGTQIVKQLRENGYLGCIVAMTNGHTPQETGTYLDNGFDYCMSKPIQRDNLLNLLSSIKQEPLVSSLSHDECMHEIINQYVDELRTWGRELARAWIQRDTTQMSKYCRDLRGSAAGYGFDPISQAAGELEQMLISQAGRSQCEKQVKYLYQLCNLARKIEHGAEKQV